MREIKFRMWYVENEVMSEPFELGSSLAELTYGEKVMQYTGLKDKNGKEIYEGDVVEFKAIKAIGCVVFGCFATLEDDYGVPENSPKFCVQWRRDGGHSALDNNFQVIGNIYENPELLK